MAMVKATLNPFDENNDKKKLYNLATGKVVSSNTEEFMLNIKTNGENLRRNFIKECVENPSRFERPIKKQKMYTFATESGRKKVKKEGKVVSACLIRDLFGSILNISLERKTDMGEVLSYPLTSFPLSLSHVDGSMHKTPKSAILSHLELKIISTEPKRVDVTIVDAMFILHLHLNLPLTFGGLATYLLSRVLELDGFAVHFTFDKWVSPSIKDCERESRSVESESILYEIKGASQKRPSNWLDLQRILDVFPCRLLEQ